MRAKILNDSILGIFVLCYLGQVCQAAVSSVFAMLGEACEFPDGAWGVCEELQSCMSSGSGAKRAGNIVRCLQISTPASGALHVCCRKPKLAAQKLCDTWKPYWRAAASLDNQTCVAERSLVYGGEEAALGQYPSMVSLGYYMNATKIIWNCGATLITPQFVLTAAHCERSISDRPVVGIGEHDLNNDEQGSTSRLYFDLPESLQDGVNTPLGAGTGLATPIVQIIEVEQSYVHPEYQKYYHDIALLRLKQPAILTPRVLPSCLPFSDSSERFDSDTEFVVTGWGSTSFGATPDAADGSRKLQHARLDLIDNLKCTKRFNTHSGVRFPPPWGITSDLICAGADEKDSCGGDSGGPLMLHTPGVRETKCSPAVTVGIVSFGPGCQDMGAYTRISAYLDFITGIVAPRL